jgi:hypothetical protein
MLKMLILRFNDLTIETFDEKAKMFKSVFFSTSSSIELDDISRSFYLRFIECFLSITKRKMLKIIKRIAFDKISNFDEIINKLLKICVFIIMQLLISLFVVCIQQTYHSKNVQESQHHHIEEDRQERLHDFEDVSIDRVIEHHQKNSWVHHEQEDFVNSENASIIARHVHEMSKKSINWNDSETFHRTDSYRMKTKNESNNHSVELERNERLWHDVTCQIDSRHEKRKISNWIIDWINNFLFDRFTTFAINRKMIESFSMQIEISQNFSFFSILYLFYNIDLLEMCNKFETNTKFFEYVDDVNILIYEKNIDENCRNFERMHKLCERWAIRHEFVFVSIKYELIHFIKNSKKFDMTIIIKIDSNTIQSRIDIRVLDVQIDTRLKWDSHIRKIQEKMTKQIMIFTKLSIFIWRTIFRKIWMLYIFVVRSILTYDVFVWYMLKNKKSKMINKFAVIQNHCLRSIFESFRVISISISILKVETHVVFIDLHLNQLQIQIKYRMQIADMSNIIHRKCRSITSKLNNDFEKLRMHKFISNELKHEWIAQQLIDKQTSSIVARFAFWANSVRFDHDATRFNNQRKREMNRVHMNRWKKRWTEYAFFVFASISIQIDLVDKKRFKLHDQLKKIESFLTIQIRIEKIDFASFLHSRKILDVKSIFCRCDWSNQTTKHVIMFCSLMNDQNQLFKDVDINDYHVMTHSSKKFNSIVK